MSVGDIDIAALLAQAGNCHRLGDLVGAERLYRQVLDVDPANRQAADRLCGLLANAGRLAEAVPIVERMLERSPDDGGLHYSAAIFFDRLRDVPRAAHHLRRAAEINANDGRMQAEIIKNLGSLGRIDDARDVAALAAARFPYATEIPVQFGAVLGTAGLHEEAERQFRRALELRPDMPLALFNLARIEDGRSHFGAALDLYRRARTADAAGTLPPVDIGDLEIKDGLVEAAAQSHEDWLANNPADHVVLSSRLVTAQYEPGVTAETLFVQHARFEAMAARQPAMQLRNVPAPEEAERRLRVGFVSGDLTAHPVGYFMAGVMEAIDPAVVETYAYSEAIPDAVVTPRIQLFVPFWRETRGWPDDRLAARIERDRIDVLVDLAGHTTPSRLMVFARRPAPVQVTWLGYPGTTGVRAIEALIADRHVVPPGEEACYAEQVIRMPNAFLCYDPPRDAPPVATLSDDRPPAFGCFHFPAKVNAEVVRLWSRILRAHPGSGIRFVYRSYDRAVVQDRLRGLFAQEGIAPERLHFRGHLPRAEYLRQFADIDLMLDPFPFSGGTVTCDSLWMGVPVVTLPGRTFAGRQSQSFLSAVGQPELIAADADDYVAIVGNLCGDRRRLDDLRTTLRERMASSPLCDKVHFARSLEAAFRALWRARCEAP